jgi:hypothetical protein
MNRTRNSVEETAAVEDLAPAGHLPGAMKPGIHCFRTHWIRGFMASQLARHARTVTLMVLVRPESGFLGTCRPAVAHWLNRIAA